MKHSNQKGAALILALILIFVLSVMAVSLMFLSQSETWSSMNYRLMTQARYGAEAGLNAAANYLMNTYVPPSGAQLAQFTYVSQSPVLYGANPAFLSSNIGSSNYFPGPGQDVPRDFSAATTGSVTDANVTVNYTATATMIAMRQVNVFDPGVWPANNLQTIQTWRLTADGQINGVRNSDVQVSALLEREPYPTFNYAAFATGNGCGSILFNGGGTINSYDSQMMALAGGAPVTQAYDGNLGSNGNVNTAANTTINGTFSSPDTGVGPCSAGSVDALSGNAGAVTGCVNGTTNCGAPLIKLPQPIYFPAPTEPTTVPSPVAPVPGSGTLTPCNGSAVCPGATGNYGDISLSGNNTLTLPPAGTSAADCAAGVYYINSISLAGNAQLTIAPCPGTGTSPGNPPVYKPVYINVVGNGQATPLSLGGNGISNPTYNSSLLTVLYSGTGTIDIHGNGTTSAVVYAPKASVILSGNGTIYGSVIGNTMRDNGNPVAIHYDRALQTNAVTLGNWMLSAFTWNKF